MKNWLLRSIFKSQTRNLMCVIDSDEYHAQSIELGNRHFKDVLGRAGVLEHGHMISCIDKKTDKVVGIMQFLTVEQMSDIPEFESDYQSLSYIPKALLPYTLVSEFWCVDKNSKHHKFVSTMLIMSFLRYVYSHQYYITVGICEPILYNFYRRLVTFKTPIKLIKHSESSFYIVLVMTRKDFETSAKSKILIDILRHDLGNQYQPISDQIVKSSEAIEHLEESGIRPVTDEEIESMSFPLLEGLTKKTRYELFKNSTVVSCDHQDMIVKECDGSQGVVIVKEGRCNVVLKDKKVAILNEGDLAGVFSHILNQPRSASVYSASEHVELIMLAKNCFDYVSNQEQKTKIWMNISKQLCLSILEMNKVIP